MTFQIIGISDSRNQWFPRPVMKIIRQASVFSGGRRHHDIVAGLLPQGAQWIDITVPLSDTFWQYEAHDHIVVFASGDPLFYGFATTLQRQFPEATIEVFPAFNSLQMLAHRMLLPYPDMTVVSLTGRDWLRFDQALIEGRPIIGVLTDRNKTPHAIHQRMHDYGYDNYTMTVGENLGNEQLERVTTYTPDAHYDQPNCVILQRTALRPRPLGLPESDFHLLDGRTRMITKMPVRLLSLAMLDLRHRNTLWDIGFCTGSVSIEAKLQFPHLDITAFEVREQGRELMALNSRRFGTPGIRTVIADFLEVNPSHFSGHGAHISNNSAPASDIVSGSIPRPDAIFIGGYGGRLKEMVERISKVMTDDACIVFNSVSAQSRQLFFDSIQAAGLRLAQETQIAVDDHNPITVMKATR